MEGPGKLLRSADATMVLTPQSVPGIVTAAELIKSLNDKGIATQTFDLVVTPYHKDVALDAESIAKKLNIETVHTLPDRRAPLINAVNGGQGLSAADSKDPYAKAGAQLLDKVNANRKHMDGQGGLANTFKKWFNK